MKREFRKHLQKYCDISNWGRMHKPSRGKENYEKLYQGDWWMMLRHDRMQSIIERFIRGDIKV